MLKKILYLTAAFFSFVATAVSGFSLYDAIYRYNHGEVWFATVDYHLHATYINSPDYCKTDIVISSYIALFSFFCCFYFIIKASPFITEFCIKRRAIRKDKKLRRLVKKQTKIEKLLNSMKE